MAKLVPYLDESVILGGTHFRTVSVVGSLMRGRAQQLGALHVLAGTEVLGIDKDSGGRVSAGRPSKGDVETEVRAIYRGLGSLWVVRMAGAQTRSPRSCTR